jgi:hypothetical protein
MLATHHQRGADEPGSNGAQPGAPHNGLTFPILGQNRERYFKGITGSTGTKRRITHNTWTIQVSQEINFASRLLSERGRYDLLQCSG